MKLIIDINEDYFEILKYEERNGNDFLPIKIIANGTPLEEELEKLRAELHETAEMHLDGGYYLRDEWIDEYIDNHIKELKGSENDD